MENVFLKLLNMSVTATWTVLAVLLLRLILKKAPKWIKCAMWSAVGIRLILPFSFESVTSLIPSTSTFTEQHFLSESPTVHTGISSVNGFINPILTERFATPSGASVDPMMVYTYIAACVWLVGVAVMVCYIAISYITLKLRVREAVRLYDNVYVCDRVSSPFILGVVFPKIYLPSDISDSDTEYVILHERAHIKRLDHLLKPLAFLLLCLHWFNPLLWVAYILFCRDIEYACDEKVLKRVGEDGKKQYSAALVNCAAKQRIVSACPLAFGESGLRGRIKNALSFKKPTVWVLLLSALVCAVLAICFLTDPKSIHGIDGQRSKGGDVTLSVVSLESSGISPCIGIRWKNNSDRSIYFGSDYYIYKKEGKEWVDRRVGEYFYELPLYMLAANKSYDNNYTLSSIDMTETGRYKFEVNYTIGDDKKEHTAWVEFDLTTPVTVYSGFDAEVTALEYSCGMFSFVPDEEGVVGDKYLLRGMELSKATDDAPPLSIGWLEEITLSDDTFSKRVTDNDRDILRLQKENKRAWQLYTEEQNDVHALYLLLEQKNGDFYLCYGYYNMDFERDINPDSSLIRYIYKLNVTPSERTEDIDETEMFDLYVYDESVVSRRCFYLFYDGTFSFSLHPLSSYIGIGRYQLSEDSLLLYTNDGLYTYVFDVVDDGFAFDADASSPVPKYDGVTAIPDGAVYKKSTKR